MTTELENVAIGVQRGMFGYTFVTKASIAPTEGVEVKSPDDRGAVRPPCGQRRRYRCGGGLFLLSIWLACRKYLTCETPATLVIDYSLKPNVLNRAAVWGGGCTTL